MSGAVRELLEAERVGVLATLSTRATGWPFASVAPFALSDSGEPLFLFSDLAEHTRNVRADARASLLVHDMASRDNPQAGPRVTLLGHIAPLADEAANAARARYVARHPSATQYATLADFRMYVMDVREARLIGGFGDMGWLGGERLRQALSL